MSDIKSISDIGLISVSGLSGENFFIPSYQRGYRWTEQQVKDLLNDINEFDPKGGSYYCLQPLVVEEITEKKEKYGLGEREWYEVIDGQQRLTTIFLILKFLMKQGIELKFIDNHGVEKKGGEYELRYETRKGPEGNDSWGFLSNIDGKNDDEASKNIDFYHMWKAYETIGNWWKERGDDFDEARYAEKLLYKTKFILYKTKEKDPVKVFTRLNIGKISLTNAELIKALFLNRSNFNSEGDEHLKLRQQEIASEWDNIEYTFQNEEFWLFLNNDIGDTNPTRIDFIFDIICNNDKLEVKENILKRHKGLEWDKIIGTDNYKTFRYFYEYFQLREEGYIESCWKKVKKYFQTFKEWYDDLEFYHYIGFLIDQRESVVTLLNKWDDYKKKRDSKGDKKCDDNKKDDSFLQYLRDEIKKKIKVCKYLDVRYKDDRSDINGLPRTRCRPLLLLHNIQTVINQEKNATEKYGKAVFYKFPFHIYKIENWNVEHIDSNAPNPEDDRETQKAWLRNVRDLVVDEKMRNEIDNFTEGRIDGGYSKKYEDLKQQILDELEPDPANRLDDYEKNQIMNFTLLDESTNKGYRNSIFAIKRRKILEKDKGENGTAFIPPCTKNVFLKYYGSSSASLNYWYKSDAEAYREDIYNTLKCFDVKLSKGEQSNEQQQ